LALALVLALRDQRTMLVLAFGSHPSNKDGRTASHRSTGQAPDPETTHEALVQVYSSRAFSWRGAFAVHTWLAAKPPGAKRYTRYEVIGWNLYGGHSAVSISDMRPPDAEWFGAAPQVIRELRGADAEAVIAKLPKAAATYPYPGIYSAWPGPNSNTFTAHLGREIPELHLTLPSNGDRQGLFAERSNSLREHRAARVSVVALRRLRRARRTRRRPGAECAGIGYRESIFSARH
jgi:hypothetical protein